MPLQDATALTLEQATNIATIIGTIVVTVLGALFAIYFYAQFSYPMSLRLRTRWFDDEKNYLIVKFEIENKARISMSSPTVVLQVREYDVSDCQSTCLGISKHKCTSIYDHNKWMCHDRDHIFGGTIKINPKEIISEERLYHFPNKDAVLHLRFRVEARRHFLDRLRHKQMNVIQSTTHIVSRL